MRIKERIPILLPILMKNITFFIKDMLKELSVSDITEICKNIVINQKQIEEYWLENYDQRFTQVLVNLGLMNNYHGFWYYTEEDEWLMEKKLVELRDILFLKSKSKCVYW